MNAQINCLNYYVFISWSNWRLMVRNREHCYKIVNCSKKRADVYCWRAGNVTWLNIVWQYRVTWLYLAHSILLNEYLNYSMALDQSRCEKMTSSSDNVLISLTCGGLQRLVNCCYYYGKAWDIKFNPRKSQVSTFGGNCPQAYTIYIWTLE